VRSSELERDRADTNNIIKIPQSLVTVPVLVGLFRGIEIVLISYPLDRSLKRHQILIYHLANLAKLCKASLLHQHIFDLGELLKINLSIAKS
jgi:hypothetical protein